MTTNATQRLKAAFTLSKALWERSNFCSVRSIGFLLSREISQCAEKLSSTSNSLALAAFLVFAMDTAALAQAEEGSASPGPSSYMAVRAFFDPVAGVLASFVWLFVDAWWYLMDHPPATVLLAATVAAFIALRSIRIQRATTKLRETFATQQAGNWDADRIKARRLFGEIKEQYRSNPQGIAAFCYPLPAIQTTSKEQIEEHDEKAVNLKTILNDYENIALGIKLGILDEEYLYKLSRGTLLADWRALGPMVAGLRQIVGSSVVYIEFEALAHSWEKHESFATGRRMRRTRKHSFFW